jgi:hypothetical protein
VVADYDGPLQQVVHHPDSKEWSQEDFANFMTTIMEQQAHEDVDECDEQEDWTNHGYDPDLN